MIGNPLLTVVRSLNFGEDRTELLRTLSPAQWTELLVLTDEAHITLPVAIRCRGVVPEPVRDRLDACVARNSARHARIVEAHTAIAEAMSSHGVEFLVLKGLTHSQLWSGGSGQRPQYDVDLYCQPESIRAAAHAAAGLGYEPARSDDVETDHLPVMIRRTGWRWRGDYYDPDQPLALELHFRFWNPGLGFSVHGEDRFWNRQKTATFDGVELPALHPVDRLTYAAWHTVRHLLHGNLRVYHVYELAHFLHYTAEDNEFWSEWRERGAPADRLAESIALRLAHEWFACRTNPIAEEYIRTLPAGVERWFRMFAFSPITAAQRHNKDELFLNLCLARTRQDRRRIALRRIVPPRMPAMTLDPHIPVLHRARFTVLRVLHHLHTLPSVLRNGLSWRLANTPKTPQ
jgi:hypothetical protein